RRHTRFSRDWSSDVCSSDLLDDLALTNVADTVEAEARERATDGLALRVQNGALQGDVNSGFHRWLPSTPSSSSRWTLPAVRSPAGCRGGARPPDRPPQRRPGRGGTGPCP